MVSNVELVKIQTSYQPFGRKEQENTELQLKVLNTNFVDSNNNTICVGGQVFYDIKNTNYKDLFTITQNDPIVGIQQLNDGTLIRVFFVSGKVCFATNKCLDANKASWEKVDSFERIFCETAEFLGIDFTQLDQQMTYYFVLQHHLNRIVSQVIDNSIEFGGAFYLALLLIINYL